MPNKADQQGLGVFLLSSYRKIPKISPGAYIFQRPFLRGLCWEGFIYGGKFCISKLIGLALSLEVNSPFLLCFTLYLRAIFQVQAPGAIYLEGRFNGAFFAIQDWGGDIWRGLFSEFYGIRLNVSSLLGFLFCQIPELF